MSVDLAATGSLAEQLRTRLEQRTARIGIVGLGYVVRRPARVLRFGILNSRAHHTFRPWFYRFSQRIHWVSTHAPARAVGRLLPIDAFAVNVVTILGLGVAIDYALFIVSRYRDECYSCDQGRALRRAVETAGRSVLFSGITVADA